MLQAISEGYANSEFRSFANRQVIAKNTHAHSHKHLFLIIYILIFKVLKRGMRYLTQANIIT